MWIVIYRRAEREIKEGKDWGSFLFFERTLRQLQCETAVVKLVLLDVSSLEVVH